jgi:hypothetical protein
MNFLKKQRIIFGVIIFVFLQACDALPCEETNGIQLNAGFYTYDGTAVSDTSLNLFNLHLVTSDTSNYTDSYLTNTQKISFPLNMLADSSMMIIEFSNKKSDTLVIYYTTSVFMESHECGFVNNFEIIEISTTTHQIDSIRITKNLVEYGEKENIKIFF